jgi:lipoate-protein ligase A
MEIAYDGPFRLLLHGKGIGAWNMAVDEALSSTVARGPPVVRFYGFHPPTFSSGRFQKVRHAVSFGKLDRDGLDYVRRPTGGQAVIHDDELTYSVVFAKKHLSPFRKRQVYRFISTLLVDGLAFFGIHSRFSQVRIGSASHPDCFATTGEYEIVTISGRKIIGSAQTTTRTSCLQHGAVPLTNSAAKIARYLSLPGAPVTHSPTSLSEELGRPVSFDEVRRGFREAFEKTITLTESHLTEEERSLAEELVELKYSKETWNLMY